MWTFKFCQELWRPCLLCGLGIWINITFWIHFITSGQYSPIFIRFIILYIFITLMCLRSNNFCSLVQVLYKSLSSSFFLILNIFHNYLRKGTNKRLRGDLWAPAVIMTGNQRPLRERALTNIYLKFILRRLYIVCVNPNKHCTTTSLKYNRKFSITTVFCSIIKHVCRY